MNYLYQQVNFLNIQLYLLKIKEFLRISLDLLVPIVPYFKSLICFLGLDEGANFS